MKTICGWKLRPIVNFSRDHSVKTRRCLWTTKLIQTYNADVSSTTWWLLMVHGHDKTELIKFCMCAIVQQHIKIELSNCIVLLSWRREGHMIYAKQATQFKSVLMFFKPFSVYTVCYKTILLVLPMQSQKWQIDQFSLIVAMLFNSNCWKYKIWKLFYILQLR